MRHQNATFGSKWPLAIFVALILAVVPAGASQFTVDTTVDATDSSPGDGVCDTGSGQCSLRAAVQEANVLAGADEIVLPAGIFTLTIIGVNEQNAATGDLDLLDDITIQGAGRDATVIDGGAIDRIFELCPSGTCGLATRAVVRDLTIRNGNTLQFETGGAGILSRGTLIIERSLLTQNVVQADGNGGAAGGAIVTFGDTEIYETDIVDNFAFEAGAMLVSRKGGGGRVLLVDSHLDGNSMFGGGGAIRTSLNTSLTILRSTISGNTANGTAAGLRIEGDVRLINSTVSGNHAGAEYGGIMVEDDTASLSVVNSTIVDNTSPGCSGVCVDFGEAQVTFQNSIISGNDCVHFDGSFTSLGNNIESGNTCNLDQSTDQVNTDPMLGALAGNGGRTPTHALLAGSPALEAANVVSCPLTDQRGESRFTNCGGCDIGAYEANLTEVVTLTVTKEADTADGVCDADCSLREAVAAANLASGPDVIDLPSGNYVLAGPGFGVTDDLRLVGAGADTTIIDAAGSGRIFTVGNGSNPVTAFTVCSVTLTGGQAAAGAGIFVQGGDVTLLRAILRDNVASDRGGALASAVTISTSGGSISSVTLIDSDIRNNVALRGGGIWHAGGQPLTVLRSTFDGNVALAGSAGGLWSQSPGGVIHDSTFSRNVATSAQNVALTGKGGAMALAGGTWQLSNSTLADNRAVADNLDLDEVDPEDDALGGAVALLGGTLAVRSSTLSGNLAQAVSNGVHLSAALLPGAIIFENSILDPCSEDVGTVGGVGFSLGYNLFSTGCLSLPSLQQPTDSNAEPDIEPLSDNGGSTMTRALRATSPAIDAGNPIVCRDAAGGVLSQDQRGVPRFGRCDIGAFELDRRESSLGVVLAGSGTGRVLGAAVGIDCGGSCTATGVNGPVALQAVPDPGSCFSGWTGDAGCEDGVPLIEGQSVTCVASFVSGPGTGLAVNSMLDAGDARPGDGICEMTPGSGICTLRAAVDEVNACGGTLDIVLPAGTYTLSLAGRSEDHNVTGDLDIRNAVRLIGAGRDLTIIDAAQIDRVMDICPLGSCDPTTVVELSQLTVRNGALAGFVDSERRGDDTGASVMNRATTTLTDCTVADGNQRGVRSHIVVGMGDLIGEAGGIGTFDGSLTLVRTLLTGNVARAAAAVITNSDSALTLIDSTVTGNVATNGTGGISSKKRTIIVGSTISGNEGGENIGGLRLESLTDLINSTVSGNTADKDAGIHSSEPLNVINSTIFGNMARDPGSCGGLCSDNALFTFRNSIIAGNGKNCEVDPLDVISSGYNIEDTNDCGLDQPSDRINTDPILDPLAANGGFTLTHALLAGSPAIDGGDPAGCIDAEGASLGTDQRGELRPVDGNGDASIICDIGSYEFLFNVPPVPDGGLIGGAGMQAGLSLDGSAIELTWDVDSCGGQDYNVMVGPLVPGAALVVDQAVCGLGTSGSTGFLMPAGDVAFLIAAVDGAGVEGTHGHDSSGTVRSSTGIGLCGITAQFSTGTCTP